MSIVQTMLMLARLGRVLLIAGLFLVAYVLHLADRILAAITW